jgi:hypothetical protein
MHTITLFYSQLWTILPPPQPFQRWEDTQQQVNAKFGCTIIINPNYKAKINNLTYILTFDDIDSLIEFKLKYL